MTFKYQAYTIDKKIIQGTIDISSESLAEGALYRAGYQRIISLREVPPGPSLEKLIPSLFGVKPQDVIDFSHQLATLIESGIAILTALQLLKEQPYKTALRKIIGSLVTEIEGGVSLSQALSQHPQAFPHTYCQVIKASEQAGNLEIGLKQAASYMESQAATKQKIQHAMLYPAFVLLMAIGVSALLVTVALPPLVGLFVSLGAQLPLTTRLLINASSFLISYKLHITVGLIAIIMSTVVWTRLPSGKLYLDSLMLKMPVIGSISIERHAHHFCQTTSMLLKAGLRLPLVMDMAVQTTGNMVIRQALSHIRDGLLQGEGLSQPMARIGLFPRLLLEMVVVGEKTGTLDTSLATLAIFYERRIDRRINTLVSMIEPVLTVIIGLVVVFIALSMITPLYSILRSMP
jgi:type IV pilus assembly protein PilC